MSSLRNEKSEQSNSIDDSPDEYKSDMEVYRGRDVWNLVKRLESEKRRDPQAAIRLLQAYEQILAQLVTDSNWNFYASLQMNLGLAYDALPQGDRADNLKRAIACYRQALQVWKPEVAPIEYARVLINLGNGLYCSANGEPGRQPDSGHYLLSRSAPLFDS